MQNTGEWKLLNDMQPSKQKNICITFVQRRPKVFDVGPTLYNCYTNVLCLLGDYDGSIYP